MNTIKTYLDNVFSAFPKTDRVLALKRDMLAGMEEKYLTLRQQGSNEHEAVGIVIANFGSIGEISSELGITPSPLPHQQSVAAPETEDNGTVISMTLQDTREYISKSRNAGYGMGFAFMLICLGIALPILTNASNVVSFILGGLGGITLATVLINMVFEFRLYQKANILLSAEDYFALSDLYTQFAKQSFIKIIVIGAVILTLIIFDSLVIADILSDTNILIMIVAVLLSFTLIVGMSASKTAYDYMLGKWRYKSGRWRYINKSTSITNN